MNSVAPARAPSAPAAPPSGCREMKGAPAPRESSAPRGRGRSVGSSSAGSAGQPLPPVGELRLRATSPCSHCRCQTAKSAYWTGSSAQRRAAQPAAEAPRRAPPARAPARPSTSRRRRCGAGSSSSDVLAVAQAQQRARSSGPRAEIERTLRLLDRDPLTASRSRAAGSRRRSSQRERDGKAGRDDLHRLPVDESEHACAAPRGARRRR